MYMFIKVKVFKDPHNTRSLSDFSHFVYLIVDGDYIYIIVVAIMVDNFIHIITK